MTDQPFREHWAECADCRIAVVVQAMPDRGPAPLPSLRNWQPFGFTCPICGDDLSIEGSDTTTTWERAEALASKFASQILGPQQEDAR